ncbi:MAG: hypothetical protein M5U26_16700 [Planctomycetota bacterium]|nr:hypothetical protein [Planctomycetota bacterium]
MIRIRFGLLAASLALLACLAGPPAMAGAPDAPPPPLPERLEASKDPLAELVRRVRAEPQRFSYTDLSLALAAEIYPDLKGEKEREVRAALERHAAALKELLRAAPDGHAVARRFGEFLFDKLELGTARELKPEEENPDDYFPHTVLEKKRGVCLGLSMVYLCLAEQAGVPLQPVHAPQHIFLRYDDGKLVLNIEATLRGRVFTEPEFLRWHRLKPEDLKRGDYFRALGKLEVLGDLLNAAAWCSAIGTANHKLPPERAVLAAELCAELGPRDFNNWDTLAEALKYAGRHAEALAAFRKALGLRPPEMGAYNKEYWEQRLARFERAAAGQAEAPAK